MKKLIVVLLALLMIAGVVTPAFATMTITVASRERFANTIDGTTNEVVNGYVTCDSSHPAEGEPFTASQIGLTTVDSVNIDSMLLGTGGLTANYNWMSFKWNRTTSKLQAISCPLTTGLVAEAATYDLSTLSRVPFRAVGQVL